MLKGTLDDFSLPEIFRLMSLTKKTGRVAVNRQAGHGRVFFRTGEVYFAESSLSREPLGQKLIRSGAITEGQLRRALDENASSGRRVGEILIESGVVEAEQLEDAIRGQIEDAAFDLLRWELGEFEWQPGEEIEVEIPIAVSVENLIMEASRRLDELEIISRKIPSAQCVLMMAPKPPEDAVEINITPQEWRVMVLVDGSRSVSDIAALVGMDEFAAMRTLYGLVSAGLVEVVAQEQAEAPVADVVEPAVEPEPVAPVVVDPEPVAPVAVEPEVAEFRAEAIEPEAIEPEVVSEPAMIEPQVPAEVEAEMTSEPELAVEPELTPEPEVAVEAEFDPAVIDPDQDVEFPISESSLEEELGRFEDVTPPEEWFGEPSVEEQGAEPPVAPESTGPSPADEILSEFFSDAAAASPAPTAPQAPEAPPAPEMSPEAFGFMPEPPETSEPPVAPEAIVPEAPSAPEAPAPSAPEPPSVLEAPAPEAPQPPEVPFEATRPQAPDAPQAPEFVEPVSPQHPEVDRNAVVRELAGLFSDEERPRPKAAPSRTLDPRPGAPDGDEADLRKRVEDDDQINRGLISRLIDGVKGL